MTVRFSDLEMSFIVRLFLQKQHQVGTRQGSECSGSIIDNHWIATSFACCKDIVAFNLINYGRTITTKVEQGIIGLGPLKINNQEVGSFRLKSSVPMIYLVKNKLKSI